MKDPVPWDTLIPVIRRMIGTTPLPSVTEIAAHRRDPFRILVSTMISPRTKDEVTAAAAERLFQKAGTPREVAALSEDEIARLIYPAGFYRTKARHIRETARAIVDTYAGKVPPDRDSLLGLPGVGVKTANLTLNLGFGIDAICVDIHVHRIANRNGWVTTRRPEETEQELMKILPQRYWIEINELLVRFGRSICTPVSPFCTDCGLREWCSRTGVLRSR